MTNRNLTDSVSTPLTDDQRKAIEDEVNAGDDLEASGSSAGDDEGAAAGDTAAKAGDGATGASTGDDGKGAAAAAAGEGEGAAKAADGAAGKAPAEGGAAAAGGAEAGGDKGAPMIPKARLDEVLVKNAELLERVARLEAGPTLEDIKPDRDYAAELEALNDKWEKGDIEPKEYSQKLAEITGAQARYEARREFATLDKASRQQRAQENWNRKIQAWSTKHSDFLANDLRRTMVDQLLERYGEEHPNLSDDELIAKVEKNVFEAFNYTPAAPAGQDAGGAAGAAAGAAGASKQGEGAAAPHAERNAKDARAQAAASGTPAPITGGMGDRGANQDVDLSNLKPGKFGSLPKETQDRLLGINE